MHVIRFLLVFLACCFACSGTAPLSLDAFADCIGYNFAGYDSDCVLQSGEYSASSTLWIRRSNITVDGAWPWPMLRRAPGFTGDLMRTDSEANVSWVTVKNIYFHGNRWNGATSVSFELNLIGCSYCQVTSNALFIGSPYFSLGIDPSKAQAVSYVNFQGNAYSGIYSGGGPECPNPTGWYPAVCLNVTGSYFYSHGVGAIGFEPKNAQISYNSFTYNHTDCQYNAPGGQIDLDAGADKVTVFNNTFENGPSCPNGFWAQGVELHGTNITLRDNTIRYNAGEGIYMEGAQNVAITSTNPPSYPISNNNQRGSGFPGCGGFPAIRVHSWYGTC